MRASAGSSTDQGRNVLGKGPRRNVFAGGSVQGRGGKVFANVSAGADTKANTLEAAAHLRLVIFVSLRMAASAVAPSAWMLVSARLRARGRMGNGERV